MIPQKWSVYEWQDHQEMLEEWQDLVKDFKQKAEVTEGNRRLLEEHPVGGDLKLALGYEGPTYNTWKAR